MLGSIADVADTFKGILDSFASAAYGSFNSIFGLATGSLR